MEYILICEFCGRENKSKKAYISHKSLCPQNPDRKTPSYGKLGKTAWNKGLVGDSRCSQTARAGKPGIKHTTETKQILSEHAKSRNLGGYNKNAGKSKKYEVTDSFGNSVCLQSSYELKCSEILNDLGVKWIRPTALKYGSKLYFADFYLPDYDIYLDPKNDYLAKIDKIKIQSVIDENNVVVYILTYDMISHEKLIDLLKLP